MYLCVGNKEWDGRVRSQGREIGVVIYYHLLLIYMRAHYLGYWHGRGPCVEK
jgi:hypothetical protein